MKATGTYITASTSGESFQAFVPNPLPPDPPLGLTQKDHDLIEKANLALGRLDGITAVLPDVSLFLYFYIRKEAVLSSQIEGTQSSISDLLMHEENLAPGVPLDDVQEVSNYVAAMNHGLKRMREDNFPLSLRLIREMHEVLLSKGRGSDKDPGQFRRSQNWLGGTRPGNARFVPPPPERVIECMGNLEKFLHDQPQRTGALIKAALAHVQFETIHPFLDGNGRLGRLLITHILCAEGVLQQPLLYLSLFFKQHRQEYYDRLEAVRLKGDWLGWLRFFLEGVDETARQAADTATRILALFDEDRVKIESLGRLSATAHRLHELLRRHPITTTPRGAKQLDLTAPTIRSAITNLESLGILREITGKQRDRAYVYDRYVQILNEGSEPLSG
ncbi:MAG: Fic family protein [Phycisphaerales bacterium]|jgi:Fic family protein|nr:Fic family protein [Phycisphaerales bacterium]